MSKEYPSIEEYLLALDRLEVTCYKEIRCDTKGFESFVPVIQEARRMFIKRLDGLQNRDKA
jgi:hypothetical protein